MSARVLYGPGWPDPADVTAFLEQALQFTRATIANGAGGFCPTGAIVILIEDTDAAWRQEFMSYGLDRCASIAALAVAQRRLERALDDTDDEAASP